MFSTTPPWKTTTNPFKPSSKSKFQLLPIKAIPTTTPTIPTPTHFSLQNPKSHHHHLSLLKDLKPHPPNQIHAQFLKLGFFSNPTICTQLALTYLSCDMEVSALQVLGEMSQRTVLLFAGFIAYYAGLGKWEDVVCVFGLMVEDGFWPDRFLWSKIVKACSELGDVRLGAVVHGCILKGRESEVDVFVGNALIDMYANCRDLEASIAVFNAMPQRDIVSWTALVAAHANAGMVDDAFEIFHRMREEGLLPDLICWNALVSGFARNGNVDIALGLMEEMEEEGIKPGPNSWNGVISGCVQRGLFEDALDVFFDMLDNETPNATTIASILPACSSLEMLSMGEVFHAYAIKSNFESNVYVAGSLINMYLKCGELELAEKISSKLSTKSATIWNEMIAAYANEGRTDKVLKCLQLMRDDGLKPDIITYNTVIASYARSGQKDEAYSKVFEMGQLGLNPNVVSLNTLIAGFQQCSMNIEALHLFRIMQLPGEANGSLVELGFPANIVNSVLCPNAVTITSALSACADLKWNKGGKEIHAYILRNYLEPNVFISSSLVDMYAKCADVFAARKAFDGITEKNTISWNIMMTAYNSNGKPEMALKLFPYMLEQGFSPAPITILVLLLACSSVASLSIGKSLHSYIVKNILDEFPITLQSALVDMYAKCGSISEAKLAFESVKEKDLGLWNVMISCYSRHGMDRDAFLMFREMRECGVKPDHITFTSILSVCNQRGLVEEGIRYFSSMEDSYGVTPTLEHFTCMVGILGDAGLLEEAVDLIRSMPHEPDACVWATLLRSCRVHSNYEIGEMAAKALFELEPANTSNYVTLSNIYATVGMWEAARNVRLAMRARGLRIAKPCSWINIGNTIHTFKAGENLHPEMNSVLEEWNNVADEMEKAGYAPEDVIFDDEEEVDPFSCFHTEKLAICFGLVSLTSRTPILVSKNARMCVDCHTTAKFISKIDGREIFVRDGCFYHHFKDGNCSCKDKW